MKHYIQYCGILCFVMLCANLSSQNETKKWYFGSQAGLDFMTNPPSALTNGVLTASEGCASISDASGNLMFYTDGATIYNSSHVPMTNGTGLNGNGSTSQSALIVRQPGSTTLYYVFTLSAGSSCNLKYSVVDMTLASGAGSVTIKNSSLIASGLTERLTGTRHCNGVDTWIVVHEFNSSNFYSFLLTSAGVSTTSVTSTIGSSITGGAWVGCMKLSPNGKKLATGHYTGAGIFELFDFDNTTGVISNSLSLGAGTNAYGVEFSPDGTKLYGTGWGQTYIKQWDLCAGSPIAIVNSGQSLAAATAGGKGAMQLGPDGRIYVPRSSQSSIGVIGNPNALGAASNYTEAGVSISPKVSTTSIPNFIGSLFNQPPPVPPFTYTVSNSFGCQGAAFNSSVTTNFTTTGCSSMGFSIVSLSWNFGDPASGANNISTLPNPIHAFSALTTYTVSLILQYSCGGGKDTIRQVVNINQPCITVNSTSITCANLGSATVAPTGGVGPFSYTWMPGSQTSSVATGLSPGSYTLTVFDFGNNYTYTAQTIFNSLVPLTGNLNNSSSVTCNGAYTATASVTGLAGGSGTVTYLWLSTATSFTNPTPLLSAGLWSVTVSDALTGCQINQSFYITQPPPMSLVLSSNSPSACATKTASVSGLNSGGTPHLVGPAYTYSWSGGPATNTRVVSQSLANSYTYTLTSKDSLGCAISNTISVDFIANPVLSVSHVSICPLQTGTLNVTGATSYTWSNATTGSSLSDSPVSSQQYSVTGSALGCTSIATASIILKGLPVPLFNSNSPVCNGQSLNLFGNGGASYLWSGPLGYSSSQQYPVIMGAAPNQAGVYNLTVTAANSCTAAISKTLVVNPTPTLTAAGSTVCVTQTLNLYANSFPGTVYSWSGPNSYTSNLQNPFVNNPAVNASGIYTVKATSSLGCTNAAVADVTVTALPIPTITSTSPKCFGTALNFSGSGGASYSWSGPNGFSSAVQNPSISFVSMPDAGIYTLQITTGPCVNTNTHAVIIYALPSFTLSTNSPVCETKSLSLYASTVGNAVSYLWNGPGFGSQHQYTGRDSCKTQFSGIYTLTVVDANTCQNSGTLAVSISTNPVLSPLSTTVCLNQSATLKVSGANTYTWTGPGFYYAEGQSALITSAMSPAPSIYTVMGKAANTCTAISTASISTLPLPLPYLNVYPKNRLCFNQSFVLEGFGGIAYEWRGPGDIYYTGQSVSVTANSPVFAGTYTLTVTDEKGCQGSTATVIIIDPLPSGSINASKTKGCVPLNPEFIFSQGSLNTIASFQVNSKSYTTTSFSTLFNTKGTYILEGHLTDTLHYCTSTLSLAIEAYGLPKADFEFSPQNPVEDEEIFFTNTSTAEEQTKWRWFFKTTRIDSSVKEHPSFTYKETGVYPVAMVVKNTHGCSDTIVKAIKVSPDLTIYIPDVFTPNGDELNETFLPILRGIKFYNLQIFNRWGIKLFETSDLNQGWNGVFNDVACPNDVYVWKMSISAINGEARVLTGTVMLNR